MDPMWNGVVTLEKTLISGMCPKSRSGQGMEPGKNHQRWWFQPTQFKNMRKSNWIMKPQVPGNSLWPFWDG